MSVISSPGTPTIITTSYVHPSDSDPIVAASVVPAMEGAEANAAYAIQQTTPQLTSAQLAALTGMPAGMVRTHTSGRRMVFRLTGTFAALPSWAINGSVLGSQPHFVPATNGSGTWIWDDVYQAAGASGTVLSTGSLVMSGETPSFQTAKRVRVGIPLTLVQPSPNGGQAPNWIDGTNYRYNAAFSGVSWQHTLSGIQCVSVAAVAYGYLFRVRLPRGSFAGVSTVFDPNGTGNAPSTGTISQPYEVRIWELQSNFAVSASSISTYNTLDLGLDPTTSILKWTGLCGAVGNSAITFPVDNDKYQSFHGRHPALVHMLSGTATPTKFLTTGGTAAFNVSEEREYVITIRPPYSSGASWYTSGSPLCTLYKLECWIDVTNLGAA